MWVNIKITSSYFSSVLYKVVNPSKKKKQCNVGFMIYVEVKYRMTITQRMGG